MPSSRRSSVIQGSNSGLLWILYPLNHQGSPFEAKMRRKRGVSCKAKKRSVKSLLCLKKKILVLRLLRLKCCPSFPQLVTFIFFLYGVSSKTPKKTIKRLCACFLQKWGRQSSFPQRNRRRESRTRELVEAATESPKDAGSLRAFSKSFQGPKNQVSWILWFPLFF